MARILLIETATASLSVALSVDGKVTVQRIADSPRQQAALTAPLIKEVLDSEGLKVKDCDAVCLSKGPGSYTGLRVGSSTAKGLCFGAGIPLIAVGTLDTIVAGVKDAADFHRIVPMIDARRMEVYCACFSPSGERLSEVEPLIIDENSFAGELSGGPVLFIGDGALKCRSVINSSNAHFREAFPMAADMAALAEKAFKEKRFENTAYFEPFYLKDFVAALPHNKLF